MEHDAHDRRPVMSEELREILAELKTDIRRDISAGNEGINRRLDDVNGHLTILNGRVYKGEEDRARIDQRVINVEREIFKGPRGRRREDGDDDEGESKRTISDRDVRMVIAGVLGTSGVIAFGWKILPAVLKAIAP